MSKQQIVQSLDKATMADLAAKRDWVAGHYEDHARHKYEAVEGKLRLLSGIIAGGWIEFHEVLKWQSLGVTFGDALAQELMLEWVNVEDEFGFATALRWPGTSILCFPLTMISKRVERGEAIDVYDLFEGVCGMLKEKAFLANAD